jgi:hypothetical protein
VGLRLAHAELGRAVGRPRRVAECRVRAGPGRAGAASPGAPPRRPDLLGQAAGLVGLERAGVRPVRSKSARSPGVSSSGPPVNSTSPSSAKPHIVGPGSELRRRRRRPARAMRALARHLGAVAAAAAGIAHAHAGRRSPAALTAAFGSAAPSAAALPQGAERVGAHEVARLPRGRQRVHVAERERVLVVDVLEQHAARSGLGCAARGAA